MKPHRAQNRRLSRQRDSARVKLDPHTTERRQPMEILAKLAGRSNFVIRSDTPNSKGMPITALDVAEALASSDEKLGVAVGMAVTLQRGIEWPTVHELGHPRLLPILKAQREYPGAVDGPNVFRVRLALFDAFHMMVGTQPRETWKNMASAARCAELKYRYLIHHATSMLEAAAHTAAADACAYLFGDGDQWKPVAAEPAEAVSSAITPSVNPGSDAAPWDIIELLFEDPARERIERIHGILKLAKDRHGE